MDKATSELIDEVIALRADLEGIGTNRPMETRRGKAAIRRLELLELLGIPVKVQPVADTAEEDRLSGARAALRRAVLGEDLWPQYAQSQPASVDRTEEDIDASFFKNPIVTKPGESLVVAIEASRVAALLVEVADYQTLHKQYNDLRDVALLSLSKLEVVLRGSREPDHVVLAFDMKRQLLSLIESHKLYARASERAKTGAS